MLSTASLTFLTPKHLQIFLLTIGTLKFFTQNDKLICSKVIENQYPLRPYDFIPVNMHFNYR